MLKRKTTSSEAGVRIDHYLASALPDLSRNQLQQMIKQGHVRVNGKNVKKNYLIESGDAIEVESLEQPDTTLQPQDLALEIVYQDQDLAIVNKPRDMVVHPGAGHRQDTLANALLHHLDELSNLDTDRPGIVHRMDKDTTGLLVVTKNDKTHQHFLKLFREHDLERTYWALCHGRVDFDELTVDAPIGRSPKNRKTFTIDPDGRRAVTHFKTIQVWPEYSLVAATLETGRTHQIRVHLKSIHHPIVGDSVYGPRKGEYRNRGQFLHAKRLAFVHPSGELMEFETDLPGDFQQLIDKLNRIYGKHGLPKAQKL